jgi:ketosteroid isomerase-like protein
MRAAIFSLCFVSLLAACGVADPAATLDTVRLTEQAQIDAIRAKDVRGATRVYEDTATLVMPGGASLTGVAAITGEFQKMLADPNLKFDFKSGPGWASGDLAVTTGTATFTATDATTGKPATTALNFQTVWRKAEGSPWKIVSDYDVAVPAPVLTPN